MCMISCCVILSNTCMHPESQIQNLALWVYGLFKTRSCPLRRNTSRSIRSMSAEYLWDFRRDISMDKTKLAYFEKEDILRLAITDEPESGSFDRKRPNFERLKCDTIYLQYPDPDINSRAVPICLRQRQGSICTRIQWRSNSV